MAAKNTTVVINDPQVKNGLCQWFLILRMSFELVSDLL